MRIAYDTFGARIKSFDLQWYDDMEMLAVALTRTASTTPTMRQLDFAIAADLMMRLVPGCQITVGPEGLLIQKLEPPADDY